MILQSKLYGAALPALTYMVTGFVNEDGSQLLTGVLDTTALVTSPVGVYPYLVGSLTAGANYSIKLAENSPTFSIKPALLTIAVDNKTKVYGAANPDIDRNNLGTGEQ